MRDLFDLSGQTALITGSTKGLGRCIAERFVEYGARGVTISSRNPADCDAVAADINRAAGAEVALAQPADLEDVASLERLVDRALQAWGSVDTIVLNAALMGIYTNEENTDPEVFSRMLVANLRNNFLLVKRALPGMRARRAGNIIFMSSTAGTGATPTVAVYAIVKRAMIQMVENLAVDLAPHGIRVNAISPAFTRSDGNRALWENDAAHRAKAASIPLGRIGEADDIAAAAIYLSAKAGAFVTGQNLIVDGGDTLRRPRNMESTMLTTDRPLG
ncbi:MAG: SDR family NAD(P)-dependent oxidoreductase [Gammaproteobacteria bacterium]